MFRTHEDTGRKAVYVNRLMTVGIVDMPPEESEPLLNAVFDHAEKREFVYEHVWRVGDLLLWDNRCSSHARTDFPSSRAPADAAHHGQGHGAAVLSKSRGSIRITWAAPGGKAGARGGWE